jgi:calreticulin
VTGGVVGRGCAGELREDWDFLPPKKIKDPAMSKPEDWVDEKMMDDPDDKKPDGWDDIPKEIADPDATVPDDWDEADDGTWEPPNIPNPEFKGEWKVRRRRRRPLLQPFSGRR